MLSTLLMMFILVIESDSMRMLIQTMTQNLEVVCTESTALDQCLQKMYTLIIFASVGFICG